MNRSNGMDAYLVDCKKLLDKYTRKLEKTQNKTGGGAESRERKKWNIDTFVCINIFTSSRRVQSTEIA